MHLTGKTATTLIYLSYSRYQVTAFSTLTTRHSPFQNFVSRSVMPKTRSGRNTWLPSRPSEQNVITSSKIDFSVFAYSSKGPDNGESKPSIKTDTSKVKNEATLPPSTLNRSGALNNTAEAKSKIKQEETNQNVMSTPKRSVSRKVSTKSESNNKPKATTPKRKKTPSLTSSSSRKRQRIKPGSLTPPKNWEATYAIVEELRSDRTAPLDSDGGEALPETHLGKKVYRFQVLIALMLSSQTKDAVVGDAIRGLQKHGLTPENIHKTDPETLNRLIFKVGFRNNKTKFIKNTVEILVNEYDGDIPATADDMMKLPGIGPKMAYIIENVAWGISSGIGVDTHMHRIFNVLNWVKSKTPEQTREQLEGWLPKERWSEVNMLWVGFGQESQQQKEKILNKALACSKPIEALDLLKKVGVDLKKEGKKFGLEERIEGVYNM